jgi:hypothetical protein
MPRHGRREAMPRRGKMEALDPRGMGRMTSHWSTNYPGPSGLDLR